MSATSRRPFIAGNWKLNNDLAATRSLIRAVREGLAGSAPVAEIAVAPVFTALHVASEELEGSLVGLSAQDCFWETDGAFTGEVSAKMLSDVGCRYVILGHSERRQHFGETDATVNRKVRAALAAGLTPIVCVGETLTDREGGKTLQVVERQVRGALEGLESEEIGRLVLAYEPVWAIGTGKVASTEQVQEVHSAIRSLLSDRAGEDVAQRVRIQYGGSVKPDNAAELLKLPDVDGALVGGASLKAADFIAIIRAAG
jgi:triosephosphate isomerase